MTAAHSTTPRVLIVSRILFGLYFLYYALDWHFGWLLGSRLSLVWLAYLVGIYAVAEVIYVAFRRRGVDVVYAFPILFVASQLDFLSIILRSQENMPLLNRFEHFFMYILISYIISQFFYRYLPSSVWNDHPYYTAVLILSVTQSIGVINEIIELYMDVNFGTHAIGPRLDTNLDLLMNVLGAGVFLCVQLILRETVKSKIIRS